MTITAGAADLAQGYEALRAQALGAVTGVAPRGRAVLVGAGLPAWMSALPPSARPKPPARRERTSHQNGRSTEMVGLLAEMVLATQARCQP